MGAPFSIYGGLIMAAPLVTFSPVVSGMGFALGLQFGPADGQSRSSRPESWGSEGRSMAQKLWAHLPARAQYAPLDAHGGIAKAALTRDVA
jgi:hypothetical protein